MLIKMVSGASDGVRSFEPGDFVDWKSQPSRDDPKGEGTARRMIEKGLAEAASEAEVKAPGVKLKHYQEPKQRPEDRWPPAPKKRRRPDEARIEEDKS